jgi:hypothetical protein
MERPVFIIRKVVILIFMHIASKNVGYFAYTNSEQVRTLVGIVTSLINASCTFCFEMLG